LTPHWETPVVVGAMINYGLNPALRRNAPNAAPQCTIMPVKT
jgi:hypothetical protein